MRLRNLLFTCISVFMLTSVVTAHARADLAPAEKAADPRRQANGQLINGKTKAINFGVVFGVQVVGYFATQDKIIKEHGSWKNWYERMSSPHFDKDSFDFNLGKHSFVGQYYYLFYRSRGYTERDSFLWSFASSLAFEFGIETATEKPSFQDMYQTPVFGTIVGMGAERLSSYFFAAETIPTNFLGYLFNPFKLLPKPKCACSIMPTLTPDGKAGFVATLNF